MGLQNNLTSAQQQIIRDRRERGEERAIHVMYYTKQHLAPLESKKT